MKELDRYRGATYSEIFHPYIMTETLATLPNLEMPKTIPDSEI